MKNVLTRELLTLNDCGCCEGITFQTPVERVNRAGLSEIAYRVGTHNPFKQSMLAHLSNAELTALQQLTTRDDDDFVIALLDAWATVADVLTFYQERIAQESYLRTATERLSIRQLARLIGYQLRPGVAASTQLAFTLDTAPGSPTQLTLDAGIKVQSIPGKDEHPQIFETSTAIEARTAWNALRPRLTQPQTMDSIQNSIRVQGIATTIQPGDKLLIIQNGNPQVKTVVRVGVDQSSQTTELQLISDFQGPPAYPRPDLPKATLPTATKTLNQTNIETLILDQEWPQSELIAFAETQQWSLDALTDNVTAQLENPSPPANVFVFRLRASLFGYNAATQVLYEEIPTLDETVTEQEVVIEDGNETTKTVTRKRIVTQRVPKLKNDGTFELKDWSIADDEENNQIFLDNAYQEIVQGSYVAIQIHPNFSGATSYTEAYQVETVVVRARSEYGLSGQTTQIMFAPHQEWWNIKNKGAFPNVIRKAMVYAHSETLTLAELPIVDVVKDDTITLNGFYLGLQPGQTLLLTGERDDLNGVTQSEVLTIKDIRIHGGYTQVNLQKRLVHVYVRDTVTINANVAPATHGETVTEIMGRGDASQPYQSFSLRQSPLTYVSSSATPSGTLSTLAIRVNDSLWHEAPMLYGQMPRDRIYTTQPTEDGKTVVTFGNGTTGARLPTGSNNLEATYRKGIGLAGNLRANQLTIPMTRPLGLKDVTNLLPTTGGEDGENVANARQNAPLAVLTLDRVVSLQDYEDFARAFGGIAKALATWTWMGQQRGVFVTVAGPQGATVETTLIDNLIKQFHRSGDPYVLVQVQSYRKALFTLKGGIKVNPDLQADRVLSAVKQALTDAFSFDSRQFGQGVALSEVLAVMQAVPGVSYVDLDALDRQQSTVNGLKSPLPAAVPRRDGSRLFAAELLTLDPSSLDELGELP